MKRIYFWLLLVGAAGLFGCGEPTNQAGDGDGGSFESPLAEQAMTILGRDCASCHQSPNNQGGVDFILDVDALVASGKIIPGNSGASSLYIRMEDGGAPMPPAGRIGLADRNVIRDWIDSLTANPVTGLTYDDDIKTIIHSNCVSCHNPSGPGSAKDWPMTNYTEVVTLVWPGFPDSSLLYQAVTRGENTMPKDLPPLDSDDIQALASWIAEGAVEN